MILSIISLFSALSAQASGPESNLKCMAEFRTVDANKIAIVKQQPLAITGKWPNVVKHEATLEGRFFSINEDLENSDIFAIIGREADLTKGIVTRSALDSSGRFSSTEVDGQTTYKLICTGQPANILVRQRY